MYYIYNNCLRAWDTAQRNCAAVSLKEMYEMRVSLQVYVCVCIYICVCVYICMYICVLFTVTVSENVMSLLCKSKPTPFQLQISMHDA
jgi:hypothetical protein